LRLHAWREGHCDDAMRAAEHPELDAQGASLVLSDARFNTLERPAGRIGVWNERLPHASILAI
jgi:hypothetical protein